MKMETKLEKLKIPIETTKPIRSGLQRKNRKKVEVGGSVQ
jgi:hypothetical protein